MLISAIVTTIISSASGCGVGGGGLLVVYMTMYLDMTQSIAQATNLLLFILSSSTSSWVQHRRHTLPQTKLILFCSAVSIPGVFLGTFLRDKLSETTLRTFFGYLLVIAGASVLAKLAVKSLSVKKKTKNLQKK